jgi:hypothetical protein
MGRPPDSHDRGGGPRRLVTTPAQRAFVGARLFDGCNFLPDHALNWDWTLRAMKCLLFGSGVPTLTWRAGPGSQGEGTRQ